MIYFMKPLPPADIDEDTFEPFIKNVWFREHFMWFVYALQAAICVISAVIGVWRFSDIAVRVLLFAAVYLVHELLHIAVVYSAGDISLTHSGIFFWLASGAELTKGRFLLFMSLPLITLTVVPAAGMLFCTGWLHDLLRYIAWVNAIIAGADIINTPLIIIKPHNAVFFRDFYRRG